MAGVLWLPIKYQIFQILTKKAQPFPTKILADFLSSTLWEYRPVPAPLIKKVTAWFSPMTIGHSMTVRASLAVACIFLIVLVSSVYSFYLANTAEKDAQAIDDAGSIRMATYRINHELSVLNHSPHRTPNPTLSADMEARLDKLSIYQAQNNNENFDIDKTLTKIRHDWQSVLRPSLERQDNHAFYEHSLTFLDDVNHLVSAISKRNEYRQKQQKNAQIISLILITMVMLIGMWELRRNALIPLQNLTNTARHFRQGKSLDAQVNKMDIKGYQELNELSEAFFGMLTLINSHQAELEAEVKRKTHHLTQSNKALYNLYHFAERIATTHHLNSEELHELIKNFAHLLPNSELSLCIHGKNFENNVIMNLSERNHHDFCTPDDCNKCKLKTDKHTRVIPIKSTDTEWGELLIREPIHHTPKSRITLLNVDDEGSLSEQDLLVTLAHLIALTFVSNQRQKQSAELLLSEERNTFARELHDSIAQTLSHLKIQSAMLKTLGEQAKTLLDNEPNLTQGKLIAKLTQKQEQVRTDINHATNDAYAQLRDLLNTFRLKVDGGDFNDVLKLTVDEFERKGGFSINFDNQVLTLNLSASEQINLLQITREALSNVHKHAQASHVNISLYQDSTSYEVILHVSDDGIGICQADKEKPQHYGLSTMKERALNLGGSISTEAIKPHGTEVFVRFLPQFFLKQLKTPRPKPNLHEWSEEKISHTTAKLRQELDDKFGQTTT